jgi:hypothetical protein
MTRPAASPLVVLPTPSDLESVAIEELPSFIAQLAALQAAAAVRLQHATRHEGDACDCFTVEQVARYLGCSVDLVRERGPSWGIVRVLAQDRTGRPTRVTYPRVLLRAFLDAEPGNAQNARMARGPR